MKEILEDALITYRQEAENLLFIVAPAAIAGPIGALIALTSSTIGLFVLPAVVFLYVATYGACVRAAGLLAENRTPEAGPAYAGLLAKLVETLRAAGPGALVLGSAGLLSLLVREYWASEVALLLMVLGGGSFLLWSAGHAYDLPFILGLDLPGADARVAGEHLATSLASWTATLIVALGTPVLVAGVLALGLAIAVTAAFGAAVFAMFVALWLPVPAMALTSACERLVHAQE